MREPYHHSSPQVYITPEARVTAERFWCMAGLPEHGVIAWHPGSGGHHKLWPLEGWQQVMTWAARQGYAGLIIRGPAEQERRDFASSAASFPAWPQTRNLSLPEVAAILARCHVLVGHDSGISHLSAAVGTTTLAFFGPTMPSIWGPRSRRACVLQPHPAGPLTLHNLPPAVVIDLLASLMHDTFSFVPSRVDCTILAVTKAAALLPLP
jgi:heptosyltransferase-2